MLTLRGVAWLSLLGCALFGAGSCTGVEDDQPQMPARPGATQQGGDGELVSEAEACHRIRTAEEDVRKDLNCPDLERPGCPGYVRVAGSGCWGYPEGSVAACEEMIGAYVACADFEDEPCVITAVAVPPAECDEGTGGSGAGGMSAGGESSGGSSGNAGRAGTGNVGPAGAGGEGGEGGRSDGGEGGR